MRTHLRLFVAAVGPRVRVSLGRWSRAAIVAVGRLVTGVRGILFPHGITVLRTSLILGVGTSIGVVVLAVGAVRYVYFDRSNLPDIGPFVRFEFSTIGHIYDTNGEPLIGLAREYRRIEQYEDIPPIVRDAILVTEDKRFFSHDGVDYLSVPRVLGKIRISASDGGRFPQGGSTITQQLVRGVFLQRQTSEENSRELGTEGLAPRILAAMIGTRSANMVLRKAEEIRLSLWIEQQMRDRFGSKRRAKEEILARYASFVYMGHGQYGFATAAEYYFGQPLSTLTADDADKAALLSGIMKAPRDYAPTAKNTARVVRRRNQTLALLAAEGFISSDQKTSAEARPLPVVVTRASPPFQSSAVVEHVLDELQKADLWLDDLLAGRIQVYSTVDARVQGIVSDALEHGLQRYERRHPGTVGTVQGSVVVLSNRDGSILAETGGRQVYDGRATSYSDFNRVRQSLRQPGSAMKPIVYLAAFQHGDFSLETLVPDEPIGVPDGDAGSLKWISNYDGIFRGPIPIREALAESRNAAAIWLAEQVGMEHVLQTAHRLGVLTPLQGYPATALGASEVNLLELATAYRTIASGILAQPYLIRRIVRDSDEVISGDQQAETALAIDHRMIALIQEGLRGVVRIPTGTAHALNSRRFPIAVMGKTGTTSDFRDALFVGSTYGVDGVTVAVRIGFDDNRSLGSKETGGRVALPVFQEVMQGIYQGQMVGPAPSFPREMERRIGRYLDSLAAPLVVEAASLVSQPAGRR